MSSDSFEGPGPSEPRRSTTAPGLDPAFVFDFRSLDGPDDAGCDGRRRWSTYWDVERRCRGPEPLPDWVVTDRAAVDTELGILETGKEAEVFLVERAVESPRGTGAAVVMAAKRYRTAEHRAFHPSSSYTEDRRTRNTRDTRAVAKKTEHGRAVAAGRWAMAEWESLRHTWSVGVPVPHPVQIDGGEILRELVAVDGEAAPRLAQTRPDGPLLASYFDQLRDAMRMLADPALAPCDSRPAPDGRCGRPHGHGGSVSVTCTVTGRADRRR